MSGPISIGADLAGQLAARIRDVPDYPRPGVTFKDITPLLGDHACLAATVDALVERWNGNPIDKVAGIEARGFILAAPVAYRSDAGFVPVRKKGKLPWAVYEQDYALEYGTATIEVHRDAFRPGERVLIVDDVLATGGTAAATAALVERAGATVVGVSVLLALGFLDGRSRLPGRQVDALLTV